VTLSGALGAAFTAAADDAVEADPAPAAFEAIILNV
jgi:hypothetical protein